MNIEELLKYILVILTLSPFMIFIVEVMCLWSLPRRKHFYAKLALGGAAYALISYFLLNWEAPNYSFMFSLKIVFILSLSVAIMFLCFKMTFKEAFFALFTGYLFSNSHFYITNIFLSAIFQGDRSLTFYCLSFAFFLGYLSVFYLLLFRRLKNYDLAASVNTFVILFAAASSLITHIVSVTNAGSGDNVFVNIYGTIFSVSLIMLLFGFMSRNSIRKENSVMEGMISKIEENRIEKEQSSEIINLKAHDLRHQIHAIQTLSQVSEDIYDELRETEREVMRYDSIVDSGSKALDVIISEKLPLIRQSDIHFSYIVDGKQIDFLKATDVYSLFGNILDNAVDALIDEPEENRSMTLNVYARGEHEVVIHADNYCSKQITFKDDLPVTRRDASVHGYGTRSIAFIVHKYQGSLQYSYTDNVFALDISFPG